MDSNRALTHSVSRYSIHLISLMATIGSAQTQNDFWIIVYHVPSNEKAPKIGILAQSIQVGEQCQRVAGAEQL